MVWQNGMAKWTKEMFPGYVIDSITNGVNATTWVSTPFKKIFDAYISGWSRDPFALRYALSIPKERVWDAHEDAKRLLIAEVNQRTNIGFQSSRFTIGYARRFTEYKRPHLILYDLERLNRIAEHVGDIQIIFAGKAHSQDGRERKSSSRS